MPQKDTQDSAVSTCMLVSYRRLSPQFQFSLSGVTLVCLSHCTYNAYQRHVDALILAVLVQTALRTAPSFHIGAATASAAQLSAKRTAKGPHRSRAAHIASGTAATVRMEGGIRRRAGTAGIRRRGGRLWTAKKRRRSKGDDRTLSGLVGVLSLKGRGGTGIVINRTGWRTGKEAGGGVTTAVDVVVSAGHDVQCVQVASAGMPTELLKMRLFFIIYFRSR
jgi:hypothetical protein